MTPTPDLRERIDAAGGADRDLDADIATALGHAIEWTQANYTMDQHPVISWQGDHPYAGMREPCPQFTASIDAALALVERVLPGWLLESLSDDATGQIGAMEAFGASAVLTDGGDLYIQGQARSRPLAILSALFRALAQGGGNG